MIRSLLLACLTACTVGGHRIRHWAHAGAAAGNTLASGHAEHALRTVRVNATLTNVTAQLGTAAFLHCSQPVTKDDPPEVSWLRRRDWHLLTTGKTVFTSDERFQIFHVKAQHDWVLKISFAQLRDRGMYECQISTSAGKLAYFVNLHVVQPVAQIQGPGVYHVERGSSISLVCVITEAMVPPVYVNWKHNDKTLNLYQLRKDIQVGVERAVHETRSTLNITDARDTDSGNYTCAAGNSRPATVHVFVSEGDKMAAIQRRKGGGAASWLGGSVTLLVLLALLVEAVR